MVKLLGCATAVVVLALGGYLLPNAWRHSEPMHISSAVDCRIAVAQLRELLAGANAARLPSRRVLESKIRTCVRDHVLGASQVNDLRL